MTTPAKATRRKRCSECGECGELKDDVIGRQNLCSECELAYCKICDEWNGDCRHVGWDNSGGFECGCGALGTAADDHKEGFFKLLATFSHLKDYWGKEPLLSAIRRQVKANNFWTQWHGPIIGSAPALAMYYEKDFGTHKSNLCLADIPASEQEAWGWEAIDGMQLGMSWLSSLDDKSIEANKLTAKWIREFMEAKS